MSFVHLHTHTQYSLKDATNKISEYVARVKELGQNACAITDHGVMYGCMDFYKECKTQGIKPILGCEVYVAPGSRLDKDLSQDENRYYHLILLAETNEGYQNLVKICSQGFIDGFYYKPRVDVETLEQYHEGLICLSACLAGEVARHLMKGDYEAARQTARKYRDLFGADNYFLEMQDHGIAAQGTVNQGIMRLHQELGIPIVVTNDCHYTVEEDHEAHDVLLCMQGNHLLTDTDRRRYEGTQYYVKSEKEMRKLFPYAEEAIDNTQKIADRCNVEIKFHERKLPKFDVPEGYDSWTYLNKLCKDGLVRRYGDEAEKARAQLEEELSVIKSMGFVDYFLIVWDFINYAKTHGIAVGPGRGSAAGSLVSYTTGITDIDPLRFGLFFERFLNPERVSMPDIDVDFEYVRRGDVIDYVVEKYGRDCVTQIVTFGTLAAKNAIRSVGRVLGLPYGSVDVVSKAVPGAPKMTIDLALEQSPDLRKMYETDATVKELIDMAKKLEGLPSNTGTHASGVIIADRPMTEYVPVSRNEVTGPLETQYTMTVDEELGLLKMDFLGLRTLTVISDAARMAEENTGDVVDMEALTYDDPAVFEEIGSGHTAGIFQLESGGMESFMKQLHPNSLEEVTAGISLYRPGPMDFIPNYLKGKENQDAIVYATPQLEHILKPTYGCIVYQEQVMQIVRDLAGYSLGGADNVRRAMAKKKMHVMEEERKNFVYGHEDPEDPSKTIPGCVRNGISVEVANQIFDQMIEFANYAFNKSHAACYAVVSYQTAYLRHYYPAEFMAALMTSFVDNSTKVSSYISVCRDMGIQVLPPDVNVGAGPFSVQDGKIRFGMYAIRSVGGAVVDAIVAEREEHGKFDNLYEFIKRLVHREGTLVNKRAIENLIKAGALDSFGLNRRQMIMTYAQFVDDIQKSKKDDEKNNIQGQLSLFDMDSKGREKEQEMNRTMAEKKIPDVAEFDKKDLLQAEKEVLGIYVSGHPLEDYIEDMKAICTAKAVDFVLDPESNTTEVKDNTSAIVGGMIVEMKTNTMKNGNLMAFLTIEDLTGTVEIVVFSRSFERYRNLLELDKKIYISGRVSTREEKNASLIADEIISFDDRASEMELIFQDMEQYQNMKDLLFSIPEADGGKDTIILNVKAEGKRGPIRGSYDLSMDSESIEELKRKLGEENVRISQKPVEFTKKRY